MSAPGGGGDEDVLGRILGRVRWFATTDDETVSFVRESLSSVVAVLLVGLVLFAVSGIWPPMVAVESPSMTPSMYPGDLVFVMEETRLPPEGAYVTDGVTTGVVTYRIGERIGYRKFDEPGDVIVYEPDGSVRSTPIIHRARFWVNESENWYEKADREYVGGASNCAELANCPAPHAGFITKGDANDRYDQVGTAHLSGPVRREWVVGTAEFRIPMLGCVRLLLSGDAPNVCVPG